MLRFFRISRHVLHHPVTSAFLLCDLLQSCQQLLIVCLRIADARHAHQDVARRQFTENITLYQFLFQPCSRKSQSTHVQIDLGLIHAPALQIDRLKHPQPGDLLRFTIKNIKIFLPLCEKGCSVLPHDISI